MQRQRQRAKDAAVTIDLTLQGTIEKIASELKPTIFVGYQNHESLSSVLAILIDGQSTEKATSYTPSPCLRNQSDIG